MTTDTAGGDDDDAGRFLASAARKWEPREDVEAYDPGRHRPRRAQWEAAVVAQRPNADGYVTVRWRDGSVSSLYHLNVREPGAPDPLALTEGSG